MELMFQYAFIFVVSSTCIGVIVAVLFDSRCQNNHKKLQWYLEMGLIETLSIRNNKW